MYWFKLNKIKLHKYVKAKEWGKHFMFSGLGVQSTQLFKDSISHDPGLLVTECDDDN